MAECLRPLTTLNKTTVINMENGIDRLLEGRSRHESTASEIEEVNETGNIASTVGHVFRRRRRDDLYDDVNTDLSSLQHEGENTKWEMNYLEAAIFLEEGENNDKFTTHPRNRQSLPAYLIAHNQWFHLVDLCAAVLVTGLAMCEQPAVPFMGLDVWVHGSIEIFALLILCLELILRLRWQGIRNFLKHRRTMAKVVILVVMFTEAVVVLIRQQNHFRVTRALRPLFIVHSYNCKGVRRFFRQILQSLPPILDMLVLLLFFMLVFSLLGYYLFSPNPRDEYFQTIQGSFVSLFVLLTTANFPDVMMPAYAKSPWSAIFFIVYLSIELYFLMNLLLAVVYDTFGSIEKDKLKKLFIHKRAACQHAFKLLVSKQRPDHITLRHFRGLMKFYKSSKSTRDVYLMFKTLNKSETGHLSLEEFFMVYDVSALKWKEKDKQLWFSRFVNPCKNVFSAIHWFVTWKWFEWAMYVIIATNFTWILAEAIQSSIDTSKQAVFQTTWYSIMFVAIYAVEALIKILGLGPISYFTNGWNVFDFLVLLAAIVGVFGELFDDSFFYIVVLRPFRLLRVFKLKRRYRDVLGTLFILLDRFLSLAIALVILYYFFAIIGMEIFSVYDLKNCCRNTSVKDYYRYDNTSLFEGYYYLNNFDNILISGVTLFELTVVNNWFIIMDGYASKVSEWSRLYFMVFYITTMVVMTVVVAFVLEAFIFRIQYRRQMKDDVDEHSEQRIDITLSAEEMDMLNNKHARLVSTYIRQEDDSPNGVTFLGRRYRDKDDFSIQMYRDEVQQWSEELENQRRLNEETLQRWQQNNINERDTFEDSVLSFVLSDNRIV